ncbi:AUX_IAA domain-containing protein [Cephalotus follicularis]|uniref:Auxin-responsive protein n=1 Tax=Cephalotus follicularis TaxID=3775 RepID=A0A1Q3CBR3_CEPFO|nr:AUX_IAA domain-containing protein [Cephalotus follicularis]
MSIPLQEHDYIGLSEISSMEKVSCKISSSPSSSSSTLTTEENTKNNTTTTTTPTNNNNDTSLNLKETELRLGLPGSHSPERKPALSSVSIFGKDNGYPLSPLKNLVSGAKRGFSDAIDGSNGNWVLTMNGKTEVDFTKGGVLYSPRGCNLQPCVTKEVDALPQSPKPVQEKNKNKVSASNEHSAAPAAKAQVVGWPPIRSFRKNTMASNLAKSCDDAEGKSGGSGCLYVKVSMDGAPYLRKVDLKTYNNYKELSSALEKMFSCFTIGQCGSHGLPGRDDLSESRLMDLLHGSEYVLTYEDRDDDWMLVGDVPWEMFTETCRRMRIMKGSEAIGLAPRAVEKCKSRD